MWPQISCAAPSIRSPNFEWLVDLPLPHTHRHIVILRASDQDARRISMSATLTASAKGKPCFRSRRRTSPSSRRQQSHLLSVAANSPNYQDSMAASLYARGHTPQISFSIAAAANPSTYFETHINTIRASDKCSPPASRRDGRRDSHCHRSPQSFRKIRSRPSPPQKSASTP